jgi:nicotinamide-nucleotide amidase
MLDEHPSAKEYADRIAEIAKRDGITVAVAESLTGGALSAQLAAASDASEWFSGGIVAYASRVKFDVLGVPHGPVITEPCAIAMARGIARLFGSDVAVAVTGVGGPDSVEGNPAGTVWVGGATQEGTFSAHFHFAGEPDVVVSKAVDAALQLLLKAIEQSARADEVSLPTVDQMRRQP